MFFLNFSLPEFLMLFGAVSGVAVALYLLDRSRRKQTVATLRFWGQADQPKVMKHRRKIQQPWSLLLQILGMALLLAALGQLRFGSPDRAAPDHVVILDTSSWMAAHSKLLNPNQTLMDEERRLARQYIQALPATDRVMIVRADALATPATGLETDRKAVEQAIAASEPGPTALNLGQAMDFARQFQKLHARRSGEIVYIGAGRMADSDNAELLADVPQLRVLSTSQSVENIGLRRVGLRRSQAEANLWEVFVSVRNYGAAPHSVPLIVKFGGAPIGTRQLQIPPGSEQESTFEFRTKAAGWLEARLAVKDDFPEDDRAILELPAQRLLKVTVYSNEPDSLKPILAANPRVQATFVPIAQYKPDSDAQIVLLDRFHPKDAPKAPSIWIDPPKDSSPVPVRTIKEKASLSAWRSDHALGAGLHSKNLELNNVEVFESAPTDIPIAEVEGGPVIVARPGKSKLVVLGFHPMLSALRYELATPLLFANILRWMEPEIFRSWELNAGSVGSVNVALDADVDPASVKVLDSKNAALPFVIRGRTLHFFSGDPGAVRVITGDREIVYSLTLPEVAETAWKTPATARKGIPRKTFAGAASRDLWQWLAATGALALLAEWLLFGKGRGVFQARRSSVVPFTWRRFIKPSRRAS